MKAPEWYADWKRDALDQLWEKQDVQSRGFSLSQSPHWDCDLDAGTLTFFEGGAARAIADIQVVGSANAKSWLWGLTNDHLPDDVVTDMEAVWQFGIDNGIEELRTQYLEADDLDALGWAMTAVAVRILGAPGAFRAPTSNVTAFLLVKSIRRVKGDA